MSDTNLLTKDNTQETFSMLTTDRNVKLSKAMSQFQGCDQNCGARATNAAFAKDKSDVALMFCKHHARKNSDALAAQGFTIIPDDFGF